MEEAHGIICGKHPAPQASFGSVPTEEPRRAQPGPTVWGKQTGELVTTMMVVMRGQWGWSAQLVEGSPCAQHGAKHLGCINSSNSHNSHEKWEWRSSKETLLREVHSLVSKLAEQIQNLFFFFFSKRSRSFTVGIGGEYICSREVNIFSRKGLAVHLLIPSPPQQCFSNLHVPTNHLEVLGQCRF